MNVKTLRLVDPVQVSALLVLQQSHADNDSLTSKYEIIYMVTMHKKKKFHISNIFSNTLSAAVKTLTLTGYINVDKILCQK